MPIATGVAKLLVIKKETTWGVAPTAGGAQYMRRKTSDISLKKDTYSSEEIRSDYQVTDYRHGVRSIEGSVDAELSPGSYQLFMAAAVRRLFTAITSLTALTLTVATSGSNYTITRSAGDYLTSGFKLGTVCRVTAGLAAGSLNKNLFIIAVTATILTVAVINGATLVVEGPIAACTIAAQGMKSYVPLTGHTDESFAIEHVFSDITQSELYLGCKVAKLDMDLPATGIATIKAEVMGKDVTTNTTAYYTTPTAASTTGVVAAVNGVVMTQGAVVALITGMNFSIDAGMTAEAVVGSNVYPDIFEGRVKISGQMTVYFQDAVFRDYFINETEVSVAVVMTTGSSNTADYIAFSFPRVKMGGAGKNDGEKGLVQTMPFTALLASSGGSGFNVEQTTLQIHDSLAV